MSPNLDSPVKTQMAVAVLNRNPNPGGELNGGTKKGEGKPVGRRRVFVQTETGCVLDMELDRGDNAHTVKRRLQLALNVPTDESSLVFGDLVLKNDLSIIRGHAPLLLTRNSMHRSTSTPCFRPRDSEQKDQSGIVEILGCSSRCARLEQLVKDVVKAIKGGVEPIPVHSGLGGAYYFRNSKGDNVAIVKPTDEEPFAPNNPKGFVGKALGQPGLKRSVRVGETGFREVAAYLLDYDHFANVPPTALVKITHSVFHVNDGVNSNNPRGCDRKHEVTSKIASFQQFIPHDFDASDHGTSSFPVAAVHRIGILDVRIFNTDRHAGNLLVRKFDGAAGRFGGQTELIPIDHGLCLPESLEDPYFEWIHWPQSSIPFSDDELDYIDRLDPTSDCEMLRRELPMIREACLKVLVLCTIFLKEAAAFGLCLAEIGEMMSREFKGFDEEPSELEVVCMEARRIIAEREEFSPKLETEDNEFQFHIDFGEEVDSYRSPRLFNFGSKGLSFRNPLSKLEESIEEEEEDDENNLDMEEVTSFSAVHERLPTPSKLSVSLKGVSLTEKNPRNKTLAPKGHNATGKINNHGSDPAGGGNSSSSANGQLPGSTSFVKLVDMGDEEWLAFLEKFHDLLQRALRDRRCGAAGQWQKQRLGTSCKF
ncbi:phosphatidylinositol 4-kinase gamma 5-like [Ananas comosus]|uniref:1-phosphatidylinositol 4-kinase n=1 Tax=Ananas comosus TaxID=4615 RepID=A0A6P5GAI3_ANACO|nr:phosphatidylinositol 4-kinase gamma 5-like [Ananas comosus]